MSWITDLWEHELEREKELNMLKTIFQTALTDVKDSDVEGVGRLRYEDDGKIYRWVKNEDTAVTFAAGDVVCHKFSNTSTSDQTVLQSLTANLGYMAGVVMGALAANTGTLPKCYGWIQIFGINTAVSLEGTTAVVVGDSLKAVNVQNYAVKGAAMGTAALYRRQIMALEALASGTGTKKCFIMCL